MLQWLNPSSLLLIVAMLVGNITHSQTAAEWTQLQNAQFRENKFEAKREVTYMFKNKHPVVRYNPVSLLLGGLMYVYQRSISVQIGAACPYEISCSSFSKQCIERYGIFKGIPLTADRLTRCTRLALIDLVPGIDYSPQKQRIFDDPEDYHGANK